MSKIESSTTCSMRMEDILAAAAAAVDVVLRSIQVTWEDLPKTAKEMLQVRRTRRGNQEIRRLYCVCSLELTT